MLTMLLLLLLPGYNARAIACHNDAFDAFASNHSAFVEWCFANACGYIYMYIVVACKRKRVMAARQQCAEQRHIASC